MIKIKLLSRVAGPEGNHPPGSVISLPDDIAKELIKGSYAEPLEPIVEPEPAPKIEVKKPKKRR